MVFAVRDRIHQTQQDKELDNIWKTVSSQKKHQHHSHRLRTVERSEVKTTSLRGIKASFTG